MDETLRRLEALMEPLRDAAYRWLDPDARAQARRDAFAAEERAAWDRYVAEAMLWVPDVPAAHAAATMADEMLTERRKRFPTAQSP